MPQDTREYALLYTVSTIHFLFVNRFVIRRITTIFLDSNKDIHTADHVLQSHETVSLTLLSASLTCCLPKVASGSWWKRESAWPTRTSPHSPCPRPRDTAASSYWARWPERPWCSCRYMSLDNLHCSTLSLRIQPLFM
jgi:hypothetical protein